MTGRWPEDWLRTGNDREVAWGLAQDRQWQGGGLRIGSGQAMTGRWPEDWLIFGMCRFSEQDLHMNSTFRNCTPNVVCILPCGFHRHLFHHTGCWFNVGRSKHAIVYMP
jgi:hypothetical protein